MKIISLVKHRVSMLREDGTMLVIEPSGVVARTVIERNIVDVIEGVAIKQRKVVKVMGLPQQSRDTMYIVSNFVAEACKDRDDLLVIDEKLYNSLKHPIGARCFITCADVYGKRG